MNVGAGRWPFLNCFRIFILGRCPRLVWWRAVGPSEEIHSASRGQRPGPIPNRGHAPGLNIQRTERAESPPYSAIPRQTAESEKIRPRSPGTLAQIEHCYGYPQKSELRRNTGRTNAEPDPLRRRASKPTCHREENPVALYHVNFIRSGRDQRQRDSHERRFLSRFQRDGVDRREC